MRQSGRVGADEVLQIFDRLENPGEPLTASEITDTVGAAGTVDDVLTDLVAQGRLETKRLDPCGRVWWRPPRETGLGDRETTRSRTEKLVDRVLDASPVGIFVVDSAGNISYSNEHAAKVVGLTCEELTGLSYEQPGWDVSDDDGTPIPTDEHPITRVLQTGKPVFGFEHWIERPDGTEQWLSSNSAPVLDDDENVEYVVTGFVDATALKRREEKLTSDHVRRLELRTDRSAVPPSLRNASDGEIRIDVASVVPLPDGAAVQYMSTEDVPASEFVTALEEVPHFFDVRLLSTSEGRTHVEARAEPGTVSEVFQSLGGRARAVLVGVDEVRFLGEVAGDVDSRAVVEGVRRFHPETELLCQDLVYSPRILHRVVADALTDRQFATLETAYYGGYFDTPRASTGDELATHFDVTRQTFNQHLRKAELVVFQHLFEKSGEDAR